MSSALYDLSISAARTGALFASPLRGRGVGQLLGDIRGEPGRGQLLGDIPPPPASLHRERDVIAASKPRQPAAQVRPVGRGDLAAPHPPGHGVEIVEGQLLPVDIQPAYDGHRDLLKLPRAPKRPHANC
jgi:hypothetical protein